MFDPQNQVRVFSANICSKRKRFCSRTPHEGAFFCQKLFPSHKRCVGDTLCCSLLKQNSIYYLFCLRNRFLFSFHQFIKGTLNFSLPAYTNLSWYLPYDKVAGNFFLSSFIICRRNSQFKFTKVQLEEIFPKPRVSVYSKVNPSRSPSARWHLWKFFRTLQFMMAHR